MKLKIVDYIMKFLIALTIILGILSIFYPDLVKDFIEFIKNIIANLGYWNYVIIFLSSLIEAFPILGIVIPGQNIMLIVGGFFSGMSRVNLIYVTIVASIGAILGNYIGYFLGKTYGDSFFKKYGIRFGIGMTEVRYLKKGIKKWGPMGIIFGKFNNVTRAFLPFIAGSMEMNKKSFFIYNIIGSIVRAITFILLGVVFVSYYETIIDYFEYIILGIIVIIGLYIYFFKKEQFLAYIEEKNKELDEKLK
ncbi:DedA family protein [Candidatus Gracilibacteria bacterium]|nr:DedA family protein [Candidatus Gracilibacteria bacterium]NUJ99399.1 DedA family protein [Candidatus Gracilibacteria bacterium]